MKRENPLKDWMARARDESPPRPDVADAVLRRLRTERAVEVERAIPAWPVAVAACAALVCVVFGISAWSSLTDPLGSWLGELTSWGMI
jgi:hypothetical protein